MNTDVSLLEQLLFFLSRPRFEEPLFLLVVGIPPFLVLLFRLWERNAAALRADETRFVAAPFWFVAVKTAGFFLLGLGGVFAAVALSEPTGDFEEIVTYHELHKGCVVFDVSGSMNKEKKQMVGSAIRGFVRLRPDDAFCVVPFDTSVLIPEVLPVTKDSETVLSHLKKLEKIINGSATALGDGMFFAASLLISDSFSDGRLDPLRFFDEIMLEKTEEVARDFSYSAEIIRQTGSLKHTFLLVLTDGDYNKGSVSPLNLLEVLKRLSMRVYVLGVDVDLADRHPNFADLVKKTGGEIFYARSETDLKTMLAEVNEMQKHKEREKTVKHPFRLNRFFLIVAGACILFFLVTCGVLFAYALLNKPSRRVT